MNDFPIIDAHLHLWDPVRLRYPWLDGRPALNRSFLPADYRRACGALPVEQMIFMQCECLPAQYQEEVRWVTRLAAEEEPRITGVVTWAPLEKGAAVRPELERLAQNKLVKGIRRMIEFEPDPAFGLRPDFVRGVRMLAEFGLTFDLGVNYRQNQVMLQLVERCPDVRFMLDHLGKPGIREHRLDPWREEIRQLTGFPNVYCKVSSLATPADHQNWTIEDVRPYAEHVFECFGFDRTVFAGDWPVSAQAASLPRCVETLEQIIAGCSAAEHRQFYHDNALRFYGLAE